MYDLVEIRNREGQKINVELTANNHDQEKLGEYYAPITISGQTYLLVAREPEEDEEGDVENRVWTLVLPSSVKFSDAFFEKENIPFLINLVAPYMTEDKLIKFQEMLEGKL